MTYSSVALLVDGDNISADHAASILDISTALGPLAIARIYGNAQTHPKWLERTEFLFVHCGAGKNASDILLAIEAMEFLFDRGPSAFVIASSDGDFAHLARRLKEKGKYVVGVGEKKAPEKFRVVCSRFETLYNETTLFHLSIRDIIRAKSVKGSGVSLQRLSQEMKTVGRKISDTDKKTWRSFVGAHPDLYELHTYEGTTHVRFKPDGFAKLEAR